MLRLAGYRPLVPPDLLGLGINDLHTGFGKGFPPQIATKEGVPEVKDPADDLDVFLRHRPPSMPRRVTWGGSPGTVFWTPH